jgi:hypothetical protein
LPRITLEFLLSGPRIRTDLLHEFSLHNDVIASVDEDAPLVLRVEVSDAPGALWEVRATVGMFDDRAHEITGQR